MKQKFRTDVGQSREFNAESYPSEHTPIKELIEWLTDAMNKGATHIDWYATAWDGESEEVSAQPFFERYETDEEEATRIAKEKAAKEERERQALASREREELATYRRLKKKFEKEI